MTKFALIYGTLSGLVVISAMLLGIIFGDTLGILANQWVGYLIMLIAFTLIFMGIKRYRDVELGGVIGFSRAFLLGLCISVVAGLAYVIVWEGYLASSGDAFINGYIASSIEAYRESGLSGAALDREIATLEELRESYGNPLFRIPMTFLEIFPIGLVVSLISAAVLRKSEVLPAQA
jgi:uncharacterized protein DUF4199